MQKRLKTEQGHLLKRFSALLLSLCLLIGLFPLDVFAVENININISKQPKIDIVLATGQTDKTKLDVTNFEADLRAALKSIGVDEAEISKIETVETAEGGFDISAVSASEIINSWAKWPNPNSFTVNGTSLQSNGSNQGFTLEEECNSTKLIMEGDLQAHSASLDHASGFVVKWNRQNDTAIFVGAGNTSTIICEVSGVSKMWRNSMGPLLTTSSGDYNSGQYSIKVIGRIPYANANRYRHTKLTLEGNNYILNSDGLQITGTINANESGFNGVYCSCTGWINNLNMQFEVIIKKSFADVLTMPSWNDKSIRALININDYVEDDFSNPDKMASILSRCANEQISYVSWGPSTTKAANENFIKLNNNRGKYIQIENKSTYSSAIQQTALYIKSLLDAQKPQGTDYVLMNQDIALNVTPESYKYNTQTMDYPNGRWVIYHDASVFTNPNGQYINSGIYRSNLDVASFDKTGKYEVKFENDLIKTIYVHRIPVASFNLSVINNIPQVRGNSQDLDSNDNSKGFGPGIQAERWSYKLSTAESWTNGIPPVVEAGKSYVIQLEVQDYQGQWSNPVTKYISGSSSYVNPVADFNFSNPQISKYSTVSITDASYDPKNSAIVQYKWSVVKDGTTKIFTDTTYSSFNFPSVNFQSYGKGLYAYTLTVKNAAGLTSDSYTKYLTVVDDTQAPEIEINPLPNANWVNSGYNVSVKISDNDSKLRSLSYSVTNSATTPGSYTNNINLTNQNTSTQSVAINGEGQWYLHIKGMDMANNTVTLYKGPYKIDTQKPSVNSHTITDLPTTVPVKTRSVVIDDHVTNKQVEISVNATDILPGSGVNKVEYKLAGQTVFSEASNKGSDTYAFRIETSYTGDITVRAIDNTGNISEEYVIKGVVLVNSPPIINISNNSDWQNSSPLSIPVEIIDESGLAPISVATFKTSETTPQAGNLRKQDATHYFVDLNNEGVYTFEVTAKNVAGTEVYKKSEVVKIDKTKPLINRHVITELDELIDPISPFFYSNQYTNRKVRIELDITDNLSGFNHMKYKLPGDADYTELQPGETTFIIDKDILGTISIFADDVAGNVSNEYTITDLIIDSKKPSVTIGTVPDWTNQDIDVDITVNDDIGLDSINWFTTESTDKDTAQGATIDMTTWGGMGSIKLVNEGVYTLLVAARDLAGNTTSVESAVIKIDKTKPEITKFEYYLPQPAFLELPLPEEPLLPEVLPEEKPEEELPEETPLPEEPTSPPEETPVVPDDSVPPEITKPEEPSTPPTGDGENVVIPPVEKPEEVKPEGTKPEEIPEDVEEIIVNDIALASLPENIFGTDILVQIFPRDIMGEAQSGVKTVEYALAPDAWVDLPVDSNGDYIFSLTENFNGTIYARCTDVAGNVSDVYSEDVILDKDSPNPTLIIHSSDIWNVVPGVVDIAVQDTNGLASVYYTLECTEGNGSNDAYELLDSEAPTNFNTEIEIPEDGIYTITVVAEDIAGNSTTRTANIKVDRTAPDINNVTFSVVDDDNTVIEPGNITNKKLLVTVDTSDALSKFEHLEYLTLDSNSWKPVAQGETTFYLTTAYKGNIKLRAFDYAGNASSIYISEEVVIEKEGPDLEVSNNSEWSPEDVVLTIHSEDILSGISKITYSYTLPDGTARNGEIPITDVDRTDTTFIATEHGSYPITFTAYDKAGNSTSVTRTVRIDKTPSLKAPQINSNEYVTGAWNSEKVELSAFYNTEDIPLSGISKYQYKEVGTETWIDGGVVLDEFMNKEFTFRAITTVGLISEETLPFNVKIDKNKPVIKENAIKDDSKFNSPIKITVEVIEEESGLNYIEYSIDKETWTRIEGNIIDLGSQYSGNVYIRATDVCGNVSDVYEIKNLTIDFDRPTLKLISSLNTKDIIELEADEIVYKGNKGYIRIMNPKDESYMAPVAELFITNNRIKVDGTKIYVNVAGIVDGRKEYRIEVDEGFVKDMAGNLSYPMEASTLNTSSSKWPSMIGVTVKDVNSSTVYTGVLDSDTNEYNVIIPKHLTGDVVLTPKWDLKVNEIGAESKDVIIKEVTPINAKFTIDDDYNFPIQIQIMALSTKVNVNIYRGNIDVRFESDNVLNADISKDDIFRAIDFKEMLKDDASFEVVVSLNYDNSFETERKMAEERLKNIQNLEGLSDPIDINVKYYRIKDGVKEEPVYINELQNPLKITVDLPSQFSNKDAYNIIRIHDGKLSVLPATRSGNKLTFQSDKFSVYFIAVGDEIEYYTPPVVKRDWNEDMPNDTWCIVPALIDNDKVIARFSFIDEDNYMEFLKPVAGNYHLITNHKDFNDIVYNWNFEAVHSLAARNIISGYTDGTFRPNNNITRAEFVSMISRLENLPLNNYNSSSFRDIKGDEWFAKNVEAAYDIGLVDGIGGNYFAPNRPVTRQEMAKILYNYLKYKGKDNLYTDIAGKSFYDNAEISPWALDGVRILSSLGIINGYTDSTFGPHKYATRAEASKMLWEEMKYIVEKSKDNHLITSYSEVNGDSKK